MTLHTVGKTKILHMSHFSQSDEKNLYNAFHVQILNIEIDVLCKSIHTKDIQQYILH